MRNLLFAGLLSLVGCPKEVPVHATVQGTGWQDLSVYDDRTDLELWDGGLVEREVLITRLFDRVIDYRSDFGNYTGPGFLRPDEQQGLEMLRLAYAGFNFPGVAYSVSLGETPKEILDDLEAMFNPYIYDSVGGRRIYCAAHQLEDKNRSKFDRPLYLNPDPFHCNEKDLLDPNYLFTVSVDNL